MAEIIITIIVFAILVTWISPKIKKWYLHHHCPHCKSWFTVKLVQFDADTVVEGHDQNGLFGGLFKSLKFLGLFGGTTFTRDQPFLRKFGKGRYVCSKCGRDFFIEEHRDRR